jgi:hypothetical protein
MFGITRPLCHFYVARHVVVFQNYWCCVCHSNCRESSWALCLAEVAGKHLMLCLSQQLQGILLSTLPGWGGWQAPDVVPSPMHQTCHLGNLYTPLTVVSRARKTLPVSTTATIAQIPAVSSKEGAVIVLSTWKFHRGHHWHQTHMNNCRINEFTNKLKQ